MVTCERAPSGASTAWPAEQLRRAFAGLAEDVVARLDVAGHDLWLRGGALPRSRYEREVHRKAVLIGAAQGGVAAVQVAETTPDWQGWFAARSAPGEWTLLQASFAAGSTDQIALRSARQDAGQLAAILQGIWPMVREQCLSELAAPRGSSAGALLWAISRCVGAAVLVTDEHGRLLQANAAGHTLLAGNTVLGRRGESLAAPTAQATRALRKAIDSCLVGPGDGATLVLDGPEGRVPLTLWRCDLDTEPLVVILVPRPPDPLDVERAAQRMGLTPAEARVARLMQRGLPNREAARIAGIREQTFNTYAKRVLGKLEVGSRAEAAQLLTWQAGVAWPSGR